MHGKPAAYFQCLFIVLDIVSVDVMMRPYRLSQLGSNNHARTFGCRAASKQHYSAACILERCLKKTNGDTQCNASASQAPSIPEHRPRVFLHLLDSLGKLELALLYGHEEARSWGHGHCLPSHLLCLHARSHWW
jgi:hypothetical protein